MTSMSVASSHGRDVGMRMLAGEIRERHLVRGLMGHECCVLEQNNMVNKVCVIDVM